MIEPHGVERRGDEISGLGENAPNEANFGETMSIVEAQEPIQVTANSGALSGLDNGERMVGDKPNAGSLSLGTFSKRLRLMGIDGTGLDVPDTPANAAHLGLSSGSHRPRLCRQRPACVPHTM